MLLDFFKVPPSHMKVPPDHYEGPQATSKGHGPLLILVATMGKWISITPLWSPDLINYSWAELSRFVIQGSPTLKISYMQPLVKSPNFWQAVKEIQSEPGVFVYFYIMPTMESLHKDRFESDIPCFECVSLSILGNSVSQVSAVIITLANSC